MYNLSKLNYYADFATIPFLGLIALISDVSYHGLTFATVLMFVLGAVLWTLAEYAIHRWVFHKLYRREHWVHHIDPARYVGVPFWQSTGLFVLILGGCWGSFGIDAGGGLFLGFASGYLLYLWAHDLFHHGKGGLSAYWAWRKAVHNRHHVAVNTKVDKRGTEVNFGVVTSLWDVVFGTYRA